MSQLIQSALRRYLKTESVPSYAHLPNDADERLRAAQEAMLPAARAEYEQGYTAALARVSDLEWRELERLAEAEFDLDRWLAGWRNTITDPNAPVPDSAREAPTWFRRVADDLGEDVDPIGFGQFSFRRTRAFRHGYVDGLRDTYRSIEYGESRP